MGRLNPAPATNSLSRPSPDLGSFCGARALLRHLLSDVHYGVPLPTSAGCSFCRQESASDTLAILRAPDLGLPTLARAALLDATRLRRLIRTVPKTDPRRRPLETLWPARRRSTWFPSSRVSVRLPPRSRCAGLAPTSRLA